MPDPTPVEIRHSRVIIGGLLVVVGFGLWAVSGWPVYGLVSGLGVVVGWSGLGPWFEARRSRDG